MELSEWSTDCPVAAVASVQDGLKVILGVGGAIELRSTVPPGRGRLLSRLRVFVGASVRAIDVMGEDSAIVIAGKQLATVHIQGDELRLNTLARDAGDWIWHGQATSGNRVVLLTAHNRVKVFNLATGETERECGCEEKCILYAGIITRYKVT